MRRRPGSYAGIALACAFVLPPLVWLAATLVPALPSDHSPLLDRVSWRLLLRSVQLAALATLMALAMGVPYGWLMARYRLPGGGLWRAAGVLPLMVPPYAVCLAWTILLARDASLNQWLLHSGLMHVPLQARGSMALAALIFASSYWPIIAWATWLAARGVTLSLEDSARLELTDAAAARWAAWPGLRRAVPAGALLVFLLSMAEFGVPNTLQLFTYPMELVNRFNLDRNTGAVVRLAAPLLVLLLPLVLLQLRLLERTPVAGEADDGRVRPLRTSWGGSLWCLLVLALTFGLPVGVLAVGSLPLRTYHAVWGESSDHLLNTLITAGGGALLAMLLALVYGWSARGRRLRALDFLVTMPYALPGSLFGIAFIRIFAARVFPKWLYDADSPFSESWALWELVWCYAAMFFPFAHKTLQPAWGWVDANLLDEAAILGASGWQRFRSAAWPVLRPWAVAAASLVALLGAREIDATALLRPPNCDTIAFRIQDYLHFAPAPNVCALCVLLVVMSASIAGGLALWIRASGSEP